MTNYWNKLEQLNEEIHQTNIRLKEVGSTDNKLHQQLVDKHYNLILAKRNLQNSAGRKVREAINNGR